jgi:hypothetical protein
MPKARQGWHIDADQGAAACREPVGICNKGNGEKTSESFGSAPLIAPVALTSKLGSGLLPSTHCRRFRRADAGLWSFWSCQLWSEKIAACGQDLISVGQEENGFVRRQRP